MDLALETEQQEKEEDLFVSQGPLYPDIIPVRPQQAQGKKYG